MVKAERKTIGRIFNTTAAGNAKKLLDRPGAGSCSLVSAAAAWNVALPLDTQRLQQERTNRALSQITSECYDFASAEADGHCGC